MTKAILRTIPVMESTALASDNVKFFKKKKKDTGDFVEQGVKNIVGVNLVSATADAVEHYDF